MGKPCVPVWRLYLVYGGGGQDWWLPSIRSALSPTWPADVACMAARRRAPMYVYALPATAAAWPTIARAATPPAVAYERLYRSGLVR